MMVITKSVLFSIFPLQKKRDQACCCARFCCCCPCHSFLPIFSPPPPITTTTSPSLHHHHLHHFITTISTPSSLHHHHLHHFTTTISKPSSLHHHHLHTFITSLHRVFACAPLTRFCKLQAINDALEYDDRVYAHVNVAENADCVVCYQRAWRHEMLARGNGQPVLPTSSVCASIAKLHQAG
jgi:hypothetical protein